MTRCADAGNKYYMVEVKNRRSDPDMYSGRSFFKKCFISLVMKHRLTEELHVTRRKVIQ